ncbi:hypothetical protein Q5752_005644 [Cryptotrichosporon argae]
MSVRSPVQHSHSFDSRSSISFLLSPSTPRPRPASRLASLPAPVLSRIAAAVVLSSPRKHPSALVPLLRTCRAVHNALAFDANPALYNLLFRATFDYAALTRRYAWMIEHLADVAGRGRNIFDLFSQPRSWAIDYRTRWELARRMRLTIALDRLPADGLAGDLWNAWFLLTENDGNNIRFLEDECRFARWIVIYYRDSMLKDSLVPGYPRETGEKALAMWCALLSGTDVQAEETPAEVDEKIFILRPYVFACAKYDITYAPWHHRRLPLCRPGCTEHEPDLTLRSKALPYNRFGNLWLRAPPHFILGAYLGFLRLLERQPSRVGLKAGSSRFTDTQGPGLFGHGDVMASIHHDREWQRNSVCQDPHTSPGLPPMTFRGEIEGFWRGKFLFYDFDSYRRILAGNMRGVYTGTFAEQVAEMEFRETVIRVRTTEVGGHGPLLCAGFSDDEDDDEQARIEAGYGHEVVSGDEPDDEGWTKEILITGRCRTSWGWARVRGRVRSWDGLVIIALAYSKHAMGRWLWRGYLHAGGYMIGRWRDTFTAEALRGYEGAFGMLRAGDSFYPSHFPKRMDESAGVDPKSEAGYFAFPARATPAATSTSTSTSALDSSASASSSRVAQAPADPNAPMSSDVTDAGSQSPPRTQTEDLARPAPASNTAEPAPNHPPAREHLARVVDRERVLGKRKNEAEHERV